MISKTVPTIQVSIYMAGDIQQCKQVLRKECFCEPICVTVEACDYLYTGGEESGFRVGLVNYPRFPSDLETLRRRAILLAEVLISRLHQWSALVVAPDRTTWLTLREDRDTGSPK